MDLSSIKKKKYKTYELVHEAKKKEEKKGGYLKKKKNNNIG